MATVGVSLLTYAEIGRIVNEFDRAHFGVSKSPEGLTKEYRNVHFAFSGLNLPAEMVDGIARQYIDSAPSVRSLLMWYIGAPSRQNTALRDPRFLNGAAADLLKKAQIELSPKKEHLVHFKQLMFAVLREYFKNLSINQKMEFYEKFRNTLREIENVELPVDNTLREIENAELPVDNNLFVKLNQLQKKLQMDQAGWDYAKMRLQFVSWKIQLMIARILTTSVVKVGLILGSGYCAFRTYFLLKDIGFKIGIVFGRNFEKLIEYGLRMSGVDPHAKGGSFSFKAFVILMGLMFSSLIGGVILVAHIQRLCKERLPPLLLNVVEWPFVTVGKLIENPSGAALNIGFGIYNTGESLTAHVARSMDETATAAHRKYIDDKLPSLRDQWCHIILNPLAAVKV